MPTDWKNGIIVECSNYRPITLLSVPGKVFAHVILARIQLLLGRTRRPQQSGFTRGRSTIDAILALCLLSEIHREFNRPLNVVYLDVKAAFDSGRHYAEEVSQMCSLKILEQQFLSGKNKSARLETTSGVRQGCILAPALFCVAIDWILNHMTVKPSINIGSSSFSDLVYADDTAFFVKDATNITDCLSSF